MYIKEIIKKAQNEASIHEINGFIKDGLKADEETFNDWLNKIINDCSLRETNNPIKETRVNDLSVQYKEDLKNNRELLKFLQHKSIEFVFNDTVSFDIEYIEMPKITDTVKIRRMTTRISFADAFHKNNK